MFSADHFLFPVIMSFTAMVQGQYTMKNRTSQWSIAQPFLTSWPPIISSPLSDEYGGMGRVSTMETAGHPGIRTCRLPPGPLTLGACQSKQETSLWSSVNSLEYLATAASTPSTYTPLLPGSTPPPPHAPLYLCPLPLLLPPFPWWPFLKIRCPLSPKVIPISPLIAVSSYAIQKLNSGKKRKEKSSTERA